MNLSPRFGCIVNQLVSGEVKAEAVVAVVGELEERSWIYPQEKRNEV